MAGSMLTTIDNPYNPFTHFKEWYAYDTQMGYHTCSYFDRVAKLSRDLNESDEEQDQEKVIDAIVSLNILGLYKKIKEDDIVVREQT